MTAEEMFKELGFKIEYNNDYCISYTTECIGRMTWVKLDFIKPDKEIIYTYYASGLSMEDRPPYVLDRAILQQKKELGW